MISFLKTNRLITWHALAYPVAIVTSMALMEILTVTWGICAVIYMASNRRSLNIRQELVASVRAPCLPIVLFIFWGVATVLSQRGLSHSVLHHLGPIRIFLLYFLARFTFRTLKQVYLAQSVLLFVASAGFVQALVQHFFEKDFLKPDKIMLISDFGFGVRAQGFFNNSLTFANAYLPFLLIGISMLIFLWRRFFWKDRILLIVFISLGLIGISVSFCRYLVYVLPFCLLVVVFFRNVRAGVVMLILFAVAFASLYFSSPVFRKKIDGFSNPGYISNSNRIKLLHAYSELIRDHFFLGVGINNEASVDTYLERLYPDVHQTGHAHNHFVQVLAEMGVPGFLIFLWFNGAFLYYLVRFYRNAGSRAMRAQAVSGIAIFFSFHLAGITQNTFGDSEVLYGMFYFMGTFMMMFFNLECISNQTEAGG